MRPQEKIDDFAFKNSNIIIEGLIWKRKYYFLCRKIIYLTNFIFIGTFFPYRFILNFKKWYDFNKSRVIFSGKRFSTVDRQSNDLGSNPSAVESVFFSTERFSNSWNILYKLTVSNFLKWINCYQIQQFVYKNFVLENWFLLVSAIKEFISKNWERQSYEDSFSRKNDSRFIRIASFCKIWYEAILESKIIYFCLSSNFRKWTTLNLTFELPSLIFLNSSNFHFPKFSNPLLFYLFSFCNKQNF